MQKKIILIPEQKKNLLQNRTEYKFQKQKQILITEQKIILISEQNRKEY